jgi:hypothetical protein
VVAEALCRRVAEQGWTAALHHVVQAPFARPAQPFRCRPGVDGACPAGRMSMDCRWRRADTRGWTRACAGRLDFASPAPWLSWKSGPSPATSSVHASQANASTPQRSQHPPACANPTLMIMYSHMQQGRRTGRLAAMLACVVVLFGTTGALSLDAIAHAVQEHGSSPEHGREPGFPPPESHPPGCVLCVAAAAPAALPLTPAHTYAAGFETGGGAVSPVVRIPDAAVPHRMPPGRGPPTG